jgi:hypothetical protein
VNGRCGNDPRTELTDGDCHAIEEFRAYLAARRAEQQDTATLADAFQTIDKLLTRPAHPAT